MRSSGFSSFDSLLAMATPVRGLIAGSLRDEQPEDVDLQVLAQAVQHVSLVRAGLELRRDAEERSARHAALDLHDPDSGLALEVAGQATIVLALVPRLPRDLVTWPGLTGYADVRAPASAVEALVRVDELRSVLCRTADGEQLEPMPDVRRSFAFFDTASWLSLTSARGFAASS